MIKIRAMPRYQRYAVTYGEAWFCDFFNPGTDEGECGLAEIEMTILRSKNASLHICRQCAGELIDDLRDVIEAVDGRELFSAGPK